MTVIQAQPSTYITGHCGQGNHEGTKNLSKGGALFPHCAGDYTYRNIAVRCTCWCHEMFREARAARQETDTETFALSDPIPSMTLGNARASDTSSAITQPDTPLGLVANLPTDVTFWEKVLDHADIAPMVYGLVSFNVFGKKVQIDLSSQLSRRSRGSLDVNVEAVCRLKLEGFIPQELTPNNIGMLIDPLDPPSPGAIHAVLHRWQEAGYCVLTRKPLTLESFTSKVDKGGIAAAKKVTQREKEARAKGFF